MQCEVEKGFNNHSLVFPFPLSVSGFVAVGSWLSSQALIPGAVSDAAGPV